MKFREQLASGRFTVTGEVAPPKGTNVEKMLEDAEHLRGRVAAINVTDLQSSVMRAGSLAICKLLVDKGLEPIYQVTCRDRNRLALQSDLLSAAILGIENILALTGDAVSLGDHPGAKSVFDLDSVTLLEAIRQFRAGKDMVGNNLEGAPDFFAGAVVSPCSEPVEPQIIKMEKKVEAGAKFFQTQAVFEPERFEEFVKKIDHLKVPVLVGIVLLKSPAMAKFMNENVSGVHVPDELIEEMGGVAKEDRRKKSVEIAARLIRQMKSLCQGAHIMPLGWDSEVPRVIEQAEV